MKSDVLKTEDLNYAIKLFGYIKNFFEKDENIKNQELRIINCIKDKLLEFDYSLKEEFLDNIIQKVFFNLNVNEIKDIKIIDGRYVALIKDNELELDHYNLYNVDLAYNDCFNLNNNFEKLKNLIKKEIELKETSKVYINVNIDFLCYKKLPFFKIIVTTLPDKIDIYSVNIQKNIWTIQKDKELDEMLEYAKRSNCSVLKQNKYIKTFIKDKNGKKSFLLPDLQIEDLLKNLKNDEFTVENFIKIYNNILEIKKDDKIIDRLKYIISEKLAQKGIKFNNSNFYAENIFSTIKVYNKQVNKAIEGECNFPDSSLVGTIKKLKI